MKPDINRAFVNFRNAKMAMTAKMTPEVRALWDGQWQQRDYMVYYKVFHTLAQMSDAGRQQVESFAIHIHDREQQQLIHEVNDGC